MLSHLSFSLTLQRKNGTNVAQRVEIWGLYTCKQVEGNSIVTRKSNQNIRINSRSFSLTTINAQIQYLAQWANNFGLIQWIELKFETQVLETSKEVTPLVPCQSMRFRIGKVRVKVKGQLKSNNSPNPIKQRDMNLKILGRMVLDIIRIIGHNPYKNYPIRMIKNNKPSKGEKGAWKG